MSSPQGPRPSASRWGWEFGEQASPPGAKQARLPGAEGSPEGPPTLAHTPTPRLLGQFVNPNRCVCMFPRQPAQVDGKIPIIFSTIKPVLYKTEATSHVWLLSESK